MREIKYRAWNDIDNVMIEWSALRENPSFFMGIITGEVKNYKLLQFTGAKDDNGVDIYDGDIVSSDFYYPSYMCEAEVSYCGVEMRYEFKKGEGEQDAFRYGSLCVIGNIYQKTEMVD